MPSPSAKPPATIHRQAQSMSFRSLDFIIRVMAKTPIGNSATTYEFIPVHFSNIHKRMVIANVPYMTYVLQPFFAPPVIVKFTLLAVKGNMKWRSTHEMRSIVSISGVITIIHSPKSTPRFRPSASFMYCSAMPFGGVPIGVARPPIFAPMGIANARAAVPFSL